MKGIIMGGGFGTRLHPLTRVINKCLMPVYDKPMLYYPVTLLMMAGVEDIMIFAEERNMLLYRELLGDGSRFGIRISYRLDAPRLGTPGSLINARDFIENDTVAIALGDNIFFGEELEYILAAAVSQFRETGGVQIFCHYEEHPREFGVVEVDGKGNVLSLHRRSETPVSNYAITGLFFFENGAIEVAEETELSEDGTISLPSLLQRYLRERRLRSTILGDDIRWFDAGTPQRLLEASNAVKEFQDTHGELVGCIEETAARKGLIGAEQLKLLGQGMERTEYGNHISAYAAKMCS